MGSSSEHCAFVLLAEFDIDRGAQLTYQFPQPLGTDEGYVLVVAIVCLTSKANVLFKIVSEPHAPRWCGKATGGLDHLLSKSNTVQHDCTCTCPRIGTGIEVEWR